VMNGWMSLAAMTVCAANLHMPAPTVEKPIRTIGVFVNGERLRSESSPQILGGRLYLPMRAVFAALGIDISRSGQTLRGALPQGDVVMRVGGSEAIVDRRVVNLNAPVLQQRGTTYIPLRLLSSVIGAVVSYDQRAARVEIVSAYIGKNVGPEQPALGGGETVTGVVSAADFLSDPPSITVVASGAARTVNVTSGAAVYIEDATVHSQRRGTLDEVHVGDALRALVAKNGRVVEVHVFYKSISGVVAAVSSSAFVLEDGRVITPSRYSTIMLNQTPATLAEVSIGDYATVRSNPESDEVRQIIVSRPSVSTQAPTTLTKITSFDISATRPLRAGEVLRAVMHGTPSGTASFDIGDVLMGLQMREWPPGTYIGRFTIPERFNVAQAPVYGNLRVGAMQAPRAQGSTVLSTSTTPPQITEAAPWPGQTVNTRRPMVYAAFDSPATIGIDLARVSILVNGHDVTASATRAPTFVAYSPGIDLPQGEVVVFVRVADDAGNVATRRWRFTVNAR
jgi:exosome complex RNA-binding protein Csl4